MQILTRQQRRNVLYLLAMIVLLSSCVPLAPVTPSDPADIALVNVNIINVEDGSILTNQSIFIKGEVIDRIEPFTSLPTDAANQIIAGDGGWVIPGLWDMHVHLRAAGMPPELATDWQMPLLLANGVTGVRDMASDCDGPEQGPVCFQQMVEWREQIEHGELLGPRLVALSSFPLNPPWDYEVTEEQARGMTAALQEMGIENIKIYDRLSPQALVWFMDAAQEQGLRGWGHVPLRVTAVEASNAGMRSIEHARDFLFDCYPGTAEFRSTTTSSAPTPAQMREMVSRHDEAICRELFSTLKENGTYFTPTHVTRRMEAMADDEAFRNDSRLKFIFPALQDAWNRDADRVIAIDPSPEGRQSFMDFYQKGLEITGAAHKAGVTILLGTDSGDTYVFPGSAVHDELGELVKAGLSPAEALRAATLNGAEMLNLADEFGRVAEGKRADLLLLSRNPLEDIDNTRAISALFFAGRYLDREKLDELLAQAEATAMLPLDK